MNELDIRECDLLAGEIAGDIFEDFWARSSYRYGRPAQEFELLGSDDAERFGLPADDPYVTLLRRRSDGQHFEIEIEVMARPVEPVADVPAAEIPGQLALDEATP